MYVLYGMLYVPIYVLSLYVLSMYYLCMRMPTETQQIKQMRVDAVIIFAVE